MKRIQIDKEEIYRVTLIILCPLKRQNDFLLYYVSRKDKMTNNIKIYLLFTLRYFQNNENSQFAMLI